MRPPGVAPSRARGLKHVRPDLQGCRAHGRALTGAWIETVNKLGPGQRCGSRPHGRVNSNAGLQTFADTRGRVAPSRAARSKPIEPKRVGQICSRRPPGGMVCTVTNNNIQTIQAPCRNQRIAQNLHRIKLSCQTTPHLVAQNFTFQSKF